MPDIYTHFKLFREYVNHEDKLVGDRLLWNINVQGFLVASYAYSVREAVEMEMKPGDFRTAETLTLYGLILMLPIMGSIISFTSLQGVKAAQMAIATLNDQWESLLGMHYSAEKSMVPGLVGGGKKDVHRPGFLAPQILPWIFIVVWMLLLVTEILAFLYYRH